MATAAAIASVKLSGLKAASERSKKPLLSHFPHASEITPQGSVFHRPRISRNPNCRYSIAVPLRGAAENCGSDPSGHNCVNHIFDGLQRSEVLRLIDVDRGHDAGDHRLKTIDDLPQFLANALKPLFG